MTGRRTRSGFTLIELVLVMIITGILATVAIRTAVSIGDTARVEQTKAELLQLEHAITGNPALHNNGVRSDFGYVGDVGAMPPNLDALAIDPGDPNWNGPYIRSQVAQATDDYKRDAWNHPYTYNGLEIISTGSGSDIVRKLGAAVDEFTLNTVSGLILDSLGFTPGTDYADSVSIVVRHPNGSGGTTTRTANPDPGGLFRLDSVPIGNHDLLVVYLPAADTLRRFVNVLPGSSIYVKHTLNRSFVGP
ncbi:MAG: prepilin-type N-terminal cleavage/methylation domain-containing protein [bacterium]